MPPKHPESCLVLSRVESIVPVLSALMIVRRSERRIRVRKGIDVDDLGWFTENRKRPAIAMLHASWGTLEFGTPKPVRSIYVVERPF